MGKFEDLVYENHYSAGQTSNLVITLEDLVDVIEAMKVAFPFIIGDKTLRDGKTIGKDTPVGKWFNEWLSGNKLREEVKKMKKEQITFYPSIFKEI